MKTPGVTVRNAQRVAPLDIVPLREYARRALAAVWPCRRHRSDIISLSNIAVSIVSDRAITRLHAEFSDDATATDVLTFQHGDIAISVETAARNARTFQTTTTDELRLYLLHGLLHLCGFDDKNARARRTMSEAQARIFLKLKQHPAPTPPQEGKKARAKLSP
ncbi:MAG: rRNA maturation RNase YbeY [Verrucomicrobiota bacterium]